MGQNCQAICEDYDHPRYHASMQRIIVPGSKPCSRKGVVKVKHLCLCTTHARMAKEGFIKDTGEVEGRNDIKEYRDRAAREYSKRIKHGGSRWHDSKPGPNRWALTFDELYDRNRKVFQLNEKDALRRALCDALGKPVEIVPAADRGVYNMTAGDYSLSGRLSDLLTKARLITEMPASAT